MRSWTNLEPKASAATSSIAVLNLLVLPRTYDVTGTVGMVTFAEVQKAMEIVYPSFEACVEGLSVDVFRGCRHGSLGTVYALVVWGKSIENAVEREAI